MFGVQIEVEHQAGIHDRGHVGVVLGRDRRDMCAAGIKRELAVDAGRWRAERTNGSPTGRRVMTPSGSRVSRVRYAGAPWMA